MRKTKPATRWQLCLGLLGVLGMMLACAAIGVGTVPTTSTPNSDSASIKLENGTVAVKAEGGDWMPVAGNSSFDMTAELESTDPWKAAGMTFETNESTQIEEGLQIGDLVHVQGFILEDGTWLANSIEHAGEQTSPIIILIGKVDSVDPWVVNGIQLNVTGDTDIQGTITPGNFVRVEILLSQDGTWEVLSITSLDNLEENPDCTTIVATVLDVKGDEIQLSNWPIITLDKTVKIENESGDEENLSSHQVVLLVVCPSGENQIVIVQIIILNSSNDESTNQEGEEKVLICHKPDKKGGHTLNIASPAVPAHLAHGDTLGPCP